MDSTRAVNTPTVFEEYDQDKQGYDRMLLSDDIHELNLEHNQVTGNESLYRAFLNPRFVIKDNMDVAGNEGFFQFIKDSGKKFIEVIKSFFKFIFRFFGGKKAKSKEVVKDLYTRYKKYGVVDKAVPYKQSVSLIYSGLGAVPGDIHWVPDALTNCMKVYTPLENYVKMVADFCEVVKNNINATGNKKSPKDLKETLFKDFEHTFGFKGVGTTIKIAGRNELRMLDGCRLEYTKPKPIFHLNEKIPAFIPDKVAVEKLFTGVKAYHARGDVVENKIMDLEGKLVSSIEKSIAHMGDDTSKEDKDAYQLIKNNINAAMANIHLLSEILFSFEKAVTSLMKDSVAEK